MRDFVIDCYCGVQVRQSFHEPRIVSWGVNVWLGNSFSVEELTNIVQCYFSFEMYINFSCVNTTRKSFYDFSFCF